MKCAWQEAWVGQCKADAANGDKMCSKHASLVCCSCGAPATHDCAETGQFVCGRALCDDCEHVLFPDGTNGGVGFNERSVPDGLRRHVRKTEQQHAPWYERER